MLTNETAYDKVVKSPTRMTKLHLQKKFALLELFDDNLSEMFVMLYAELHDSSHCWLNYGWTFDDLPEEKMGV